MPPTQLAGELDLATSLATRSVGLIMEECHAVCEV